MRPLFANYADGTRQPLTDDEQVLAALSVPGTVVHDVAVAAAPLPRRAVWEVDEDVLAVDG